MGGCQEQSWFWDFHIAAENLLNSPVAIQEALELIDILGGVIPVEGGEDTVKWRPKSDGAFSIKSRSSFLREP